MLLSFLRHALLLPEPATPQPDIPLTGVSTDSRQIKPGQLFAAIAGPNFDGHTFIDVAIAKGCAALLLQTPPTKPMPVPVLLVPDVLVALGQAGRAWRQQVNPITIAVTGSSGKTTVKEMIAAALAQQFDQVFATQGNLNNHIGLPLTLLAIPAGCQALVVEMGMSGAGEIAHLTQLAQPDIGVITNVQPAHMSAFDSIQAIAAAKSELFANLPANSLCLLPLYDPNRDILQQQVGSRPLLTFGTTPEAMVYWQPHLNDLGAEIRGTLHWRQEKSSVTITLGQYGPHMILNALAAAGAARAAGVAPEAIAHALSHFAPLQGRGLINTIPFGEAEEISLIDDTYNANPGSITAALTALGRHPTSRRRVAILGDMLELGEQAEKLHAQLADTIANQRIELLITAGPLMHALHEAITRNNTLEGAFKVTCLHKQDPANWLGAIQPWLQANDIVLVKGSRGMRMERIVKDLTHHAV